MQIASIYDPIQQDLQKVGENLRSLSKTDLIPADDLLAHALGGMGKGVRPALTLLSGKFYHYDLDLLLPMATAVELLHIATLVHDDTIDGAALRRSKPTVSSIWGKETALIVGDYLFATSADLVSTTESVLAMRLFARTLMVISAGELQQNFSAYRPGLTRPEYYRRIQHKTASLFAMACETGALLSQAPASACQAMRDYGNHLGMGFQIVDDILDFIGDRSELGKPVGNDLIQGTVTLPAIIFGEMYPGNDYVKHALESKGNPDKVKRAVEAIAASAAIKKAYDLALDECRQARESLSGMPPNPCRQPLETLTEYVVDRNR
ncbi:MAG: polyprenyl synthetase family protein [Chloroflexi bacterium]|nr:polyprenyl synthetase family protein [Chloroflexota bacterium]